MPAEDRFESLEVQVRSAPSPRGPTRYGAATRLIWRLMARLNRHEREHYERTFLALLERLRQATEATNRLEELVVNRERAESAHAGRPLLNDGSGARVLAIYRAALRSALGAHRGRAFDSAVEEAASDSGRLLFPTFDRF